MYKIFIVMFPGFAYIFVLKLFQHFHLFPDRYARKLCDNFHYGKGNC